MALKKGNDGIERAFNPCICRLCRGTTGVGPPQPAISEVPTACAVICPKHKRVYLSDHEYCRQLRKADTKWVCPKCGEESVWDEINAEGAYGW